MKPRGFRTCHPPSLWKSWAKSNHHHVYHHHKIIKLVELDKVLRGKSKKMNGLSSILDQFNEIGMVLLCHFPQIMFWITSQYYGFQWKIISNVSFLYVISVLSMHVFSIHKFIDIAFKISELNICTFYCNDMPLPFFWATFSGKVPLWQPVIKNYNN